MGIHGLRNKGTSLIEVIIATLIISLFSVALFRFFDIQNKNMYVFINKAYSEDMLEEATLFFNTYPYKDIPIGLYSLAYKKGTIPAFSLEKVSKDDALIESGKYIDVSGVAFTGSDIATRTDLFKRIILIEAMTSGSVLSPNVKKVRISIWYPGCDFRGAPCTEKEFLLIEPRSYE